MAVDTKKAFWDEKNTEFVTATYDFDLLHPQFRESDHNRGSVGLAGREGQQPGVRDLRRS